MLHKVHEEEYVHGDIRIENIVFAAEENTSYLIDFDLAKKEGKRSTPLVIIAKIFGSSLL